MTKPVRYYIQPHDNAQALVRGVPVPLPAQEKRIAAEPRPLVAPSPSPPTPTPREAPRPSRMTRLVRAAIRRADADR